jgi:hypothetical protein
LHFLTVAQHWTIQRGSGESNAVQQVGFRIRPFHPGSSRSYIASNDGVPACAALALPRSLQVSSCMPPVSAQAAPERRESPPQSSAGYNKDFSRMVGCKSEGRASTVRPDPDATDLCWGFRVLAASIRKSCFLSFCSAMSSARWCGWRGLICSCQTTDTLAGDKVEPGEGTSSDKPSVVVASPSPPGKVQRCFNHRFIPCFPGNGGEFYPFLCSSPLGPVSQHAQEKTLHCV